MQDRSVTSQLAPALCPDCTDMALCEKHAVARLAIDKMMQGRAVVDTVNYGETNNIIPMRRPGNIADTRAAFIERMRNTPVTNRITGETYLVTELKPSSVFRKCKTCHCDVNNIDTHGYTKDDAGRAVACPDCTPQVLRARGIKKTEACILQLFHAGKIFNTQNLPADAHKLTMDKYPDRGDLEAKAQVQLFIDGEIDDIFLTGKPGVGKTGLAIAAGKVLASQGKQIFILSSNDYIDLLQENFQPGAKDNNIKYILKNVEVLFYDDLAAENASAFTLKEIQEVIEYRHNAGLKTCITSNLNLKQLEKYWLLKTETGFQPASRTISRLRGWYEVVAFTGAELR